LYLHILAEVAFVVTVHISKITQHEASSLNNTFISIYTTYCSCNFKTANWHEDTWLLWKRCNLFRHDRFFALWRFFQQIL